MAERYSRAGMALMQLPGNAQPVYGIDSARDYPDGAPLAVQHDALGMLHARAGELPEAEDHLRRALEISPAFVRGNLDLSLLLSEKGESLESLHCLLRAERGARRAADAHTVAALMRSLARDFGDKGRIRMAHALLARAGLLERAGAGPIGR
jgi:tetratricopeptide (TPR) repeat protein